MESWSRRKVKKPFTSMEIRQTQNSCFKHCILWSVNKLARAVTKWNQASDRRFARLISYIHRTNDFRQHCHVGNPAQHRRLGVFQDSAFTGDHENSKLTSMEFLVSSGSGTFVPTSWMCKKQTSVSHSSIQSEATSLDASLRGRNSRSWSVAWSFTSTQSTVQPVAW